MIKVRLHQSQLTLTIS